MTHTIPEICQTIEERIRTIHIRCFRGRTEPLFLISDTYPGIWLEHVYDSVLYARMYPAEIHLAENTIRLFLSYQTTEGQLPCYVWNGDKLPHLPAEALVGYGQVQECVSFAALCLEVAKMTNDRAFLTEVYDGCCRWDNWLRKYRMTTKHGLIEMFVGYDTGHDNSGRLSDMAHPHNHVSPEGKICNASHLPEDDGVTPILALDMNCNFYATQTALAEMAELLGKTEEAADWREKSREVKTNILTQLYDPEDAFFYDADRNGKLRKYKCSTIFHLFLEGVLDPVADAEHISEIYMRHIKNPEEFWTPYPFPSMAANDPSFRKHTASNCWGYFSEGLIALRCTRWMDRYGFSTDFDVLCEKYLEAWTRCYDKVKLGQELDPFTGEPSAASEWYSSGMLFYLYAAKRCGKIG